MRRVLTTFGFGADCERLMTLSVPTFARYADAHGYDLFVPGGSYFARWNSVLDERCASWLKVLAIRDLLESHDEVLWIDCDVVVLKFDKDISDDLTPAPLHMVVHKTEDGEVPNCGVWHARKQAAATLESLWQHTGFRRSGGWWEQAALIHVLGGDPDATPTHTPPGPLWGELPYCWNPHIRDARRIPSDCRFFHATQFPDRFSAMLAMRSANDPSA